MINAHQPDTVYSSYLAARYRAMGFPIVREDKKLEKFEWYHSSAPSQVSVMEIAQ